MLELYQIEGCPDCDRVRRALADLLLDFVVRQVPTERTHRSRLTQVTGQDGVPTLVDSERRMIVTEAHDIIAYLHENYGDRFAREDPSI